MYTQLNVLSIVSPATVFIRIWHFVDSSGVRKSPIHFKMNTTVITFDQGLYYKAKELQFFKSSECLNMIIKLGGFRIIMNFLKVIRQPMDGLGLSDIWIESNLLADCTALKILQGIY